MTGIEPAVVFENEEFLVLDKPSGWHSVMGKGDDRGERSVEAWLRERDAEAEHLPEAGLVHRLDRGTSGCLVAAKTFEASDVLQEQLRLGHCLGSVPEVGGRSICSDSESFVPE